jgi:hypothetical protein
MALILVATAKHILLLYIVCCSKPDARTYINKRHFAAALSIVVTERSRSLVYGRGLPPVVVHCISTTLCSKIARSHRRMGEAQGRSLRRKAGDRVVPGRTQDQVWCMHSADAHRRWHHSTAASMVRTAGPTRCSLDNPRWCLAPPRLPHSALSVGATLHRQRLVEGHGRDQGWPGPAARCTTAAAAPTPRDLDLPLPRAPWPSNGACARPEAASGADPARSGDA